MSDAIFRQCRTCKHWNQGHGNLFTRGWGRCDGIPQGHKATSEPPFIYGWTPRSVITPADWFCASWEAKRGRQ